jgi:uncharacterized protein YkwD
MAANFADAARRAPTLILAAASLAWAVLTPSPRAEAASISEVLTAARSVRARGCEQHGGVRVPLRTSIALDGAAVQWSRGSAFQAAITRSGYRGDRSAGLHLSGDDPSLGATLAAHLCSTLTDPGVTDIGIYQHLGGTWIVVAAPFEAPAPMAADSVAAEVLQLVNAARGVARRCGSSTQAAVPPVRLNALLNQAALAHAQDMLRYDYFDHIGHDGSSPAQRVDAIGYRHRLVGENIALGPETAQEAVRGWLSSPGHCENIMDPRFTELGVAFAANRSGEPRIYWVQAFAAPR